MKRMLLIITLTFFLSGCDISDELCAIEGDPNGPKIWAFFQFNVIEENDKLESYYYFGHISKSLFQKINTNTLTQGFILLEKVRYWGDDDLIHEYKDDEYSGDLLFRIEDIQRMKMVSSDPLLGFKPVQNTPIAPTPPDPTPAAPKILTRSNK